MFFGFILRWIYEVSKATTNTPFIVGLLSLLCRFCCFETRIRRGSFRLHFIRVWDASPPPELEREGVWAPPFGTTFTMASEEWSNGLVVVVRHFYSITVLFYTFTDCVQHWVLCLVANIIVIIAENFNTETSIIYLYSQELYWTVVAVRV